MQDERPISFIGTTAAGETSEAAHEFTDSGVVTGATIITHTGQEYGLRQTVEIIRNGSPVSLWQGLGEAYLAGDGEDFELSVRFEFERGDVIRFKAENTTTYDYHHNMTVTVDYEENTLERITSALRGVV